MGKHAVFMALGLIVGLLVGFALRGALTWGPTPATNPGHLSAGTPDRGHTAPVANADAGRPSVPVQNTAADPQPARGEPPSLAQLIASADIPPLPKGDGTITGRVLTAAGEAVAGVVVTAMPDYPGDHRGSAKTADERIAARLRQETWKEMAKHETVTSTDGSYTVAGLDPATDYHLWALADGWQIQRVNRYSGFRVGDVCDFVAKVSIALKVLVYMPDGTPAKNGQVGCGKPGGRGPRAGGNVNRGSAIVHLEPGDWEVTVTSGNFDELRSGALEITVAAGDHPEPVTLHLKAIPGILGTATDESGARRPANLEVFLQVNPPEEPPAAAFPRNSPLRSERPHSNKFAFMELESRTYRVLLVANDMVVDWKDVAVSDGTVDVSLRVPEPALEDCIVVRVHGPDNKLISNVDFSLTKHTSKAIVGRGANESLRGDGSFLLHKGQFTSEAQEEGHYVITVRSADYGEKHVRYDLADTSEVDIRFLDPALVTLSVPNFNDHPLREKLSWRLLSADESEQRWRLQTYRYDADGAMPASPFNLGPMEPGDYFLVLSCNVSTFDNRELSRRRLTLAAGENTLTESVPALFTLTITGETDYDIELQAKDGGYCFDSDSRDVVDGKRKIEYVPAGSYLLTSSRGEMEIFVSSDTAVAFEPHDE